MSCPLLFWGRHWFLILAMNLAADCDAMLGELPHSIDKWAFPFLTDRFKYPGAPVARLGAVVDPPAVTRRRWQE